MTNEENQDKEKPKNIKMIDSQKSKLLILEIFLKIFVIISVILALTLYFYYKGNTFYEDEVSMTKDIHHLKAYFKGYENIHHGIKGYVDITEVHEGLNINGRIEGLRQGTTHGIHVLEYSDITDLEKNKITDDVLKHYNPMNKPHSCPSTNYEEDETFHFGDFGNVIANQDGIAFISIIRNIPLRSLNGRIIVISGVQDKCNAEQEHVLVKDIIGYGLLNAYKPKISMGVNKSNDYFLREINSVNKKEFENKNKIIKPVIKNTFNRPELHIPPVISSHKEEPKPIIKPFNRTGNQHIPMVKQEQKVFDKDRNELDTHAENPEIFEEDERKIIKTNPKFFPNPIRNSFPNQWNRNLSFPPINEKIKSDHKPIQNKVESHQEHNILDTDASSDSYNIKNNKSAVPHQITPEKESELELKGETPPKFNLFENLFEKENQSEFDKNDSNTILEKPEPILINKSNEPQFLHMTQEHKMISPYSQGVPIYQKKAEASRFNPFIRNLPKPVQKIQESREDISNSKLDDVFSKFFRDKDADNKMPFFTPILPQNSIKTVNLYPNILTRPSSMEGLPINQNMHQASIQPYKGIHMFNIHSAHEPSNDLNTKPPAGNMDHAWATIPPKDFSFNPFKDNSFDSLPSNAFQEISSKSINENPLIKPRFDFSFMEPNIEPLVHGLMKNSTSTKLVRNLDQDLLNPYNDNIILDRAAVDNNRFDADSFILNLNKKLIKGDNKQKTHPSFIIEEKSDKHDEMDVMNKINNIQEIIKNKTISQLNNFKNPLHLTNNIINKKQENLVNSPSTSNFNIINKIDPFENFKLLKFREKNATPAIDNIKEAQKESRNIPILNNSLISSSVNLSPIINKSSKTVKDSKDLPPESTNKMMENISSEENKIKHLNLYDEDKLFIKDVKNNINKLDNISNNFKNI